MYFRANGSRANKAPSQNDASYAFARPSPHTHPLAHPFLTLQQSIGNQNTQRLLRARLESSPWEPPNGHDVPPYSPPAQQSGTAARADTEAQRLGHNFAQVRIYAPARAVSTERAASVHGMEKIRWEQRQPVRFDPLGDPRLSIHTPAWTRSGTIHMGVPALFMPRAERQRMLRHEAVHSLHQRLAPPSESMEAHERAERVAARGEQNFSALSLADLLSPAPVLLAFPPQTDRPWGKIWVGKFGLVMEVEESGVAVRIYRSYEELGISANNVYCGKPDLPSLQELAPRMRQVAKKAAQINEKMPATAIAQRVALVTIFGIGSSSYASANGRGLLELTENEFAGEDFEDTVAHEVSHAIFEFHSVRKDPAKRKPDWLALRVTDLYLRLQQTKRVPKPTKRFDPQSPPSLAEARDGLPAGIVMVTDTLWSGRAGHPWQGPHEFFASAYAGFLEERELFEQIIDYYAQPKGDPKIGPLKTELIELLSRIGKLTESESGEKPQIARAKQQEAQKELAKMPDYVVSPPPDSPLDWLIAPERMSEPRPEEIVCTNSTTSPEPIDKLPEFEEAFPPTQAPPPKPLPETK